MVLLFRRSNRRVYFKVPGVKGHSESSAKEATTLLKTGDFVKVPVKLSDGSQNGTKGEEA